ncbi:aminoglycoside phosphotransferase family protein [Actinopolymorpha singaporensis]|uniref:Streptomycin 6-kinase n=1 Tax=Actinopolymorpha singaporensis TaxID=117157 RepID=A0A1H1P0K8_9ACTN|nr:aminoglycoside phosphotransferase family protein [Actinopolymorpha singaporensis]SDS04768.1 streptomycin 6-kinase [Actinopolymorpha singaporensis]
MTEATNAAQAAEAEAGIANRLVPVGLAERIRSYYPAGGAWLDELPRLIATCARRWDLTLLPAFEPGGDSSWTAPVRRRDGELAVLQITVPMPVASDHVTALKAWAGRGAVRLFAHDEAIRATLMECCVPGTHAEHLSPADADAVAVAVLPELWAADLPGLSDADCLESLDAAAGKRALLMEERAEKFGDVVDAGPFREAAQLFTSLPASANRSVLLHGDFHRRNVVLSQRGWLAIDPLAMVGDPSYDAALFLQHDLDGAVTPARVDALADRLELDRERTRRWLFALGVQAASWHLSIGDRTTHDAIIETTSTLLTG